MVEPKDSEAAMEQIIGDLEKKEKEIEELKVISIFVIVPEKFFVFCGGVVFFFLFLILFSLVEKNWEIGSKEIIIYEY